MAPTPNVRFLDRLPGRSLADQVKSGLLGATPLRRLVRGVDACLARRGAPSARASGRYQGDDIDGIARIWRDGRANVRLGGRLSYTNPGLSPPQDGGRAPPKPTILPKIEHNVNWEDSHVSNRGDSDSVVEGTD